MQERITFHFQGGLADEHRMNFYESARFQYAAARLLVKLAQFRRNGRFVQKITKGSNIAVNLVSQSDGSFNINLEDSDKAPVSERFTDLLLSDLIAYVGERIIEKLDEATMQQVAIPLRAGSPLVRGSEDESTSNLDQLAKAVIDGDVSIDDLRPRDLDLLRRRAAETNRENRLAERQIAIGKIDAASSQKLVAMAAPLIKDMATALRRSAELLEVLASVDGAARPVLYLNSQMARDIETTSVDDKIIPILCNVFQFNKINGWGKLTIDDNGPKALSFSVPSDILPIMRQQLIDQMKRDYVYLQTYFVRDRSGEVKRLIAVGILQTPENLPL